MAMNFALRDALVAFEFAQKIIQARNVSEFTKIFAEFVNPQMQVLSEQWRDLGETFSKAAIDSTDISKTSDQIEQAIGSGDGRDAFCAAAMVRSA